MLAWLFLDHKPFVHIFSQLVSQRHDHENKTSAKGSQNRRDCRAAMTTPLANQNDSGGPIRLSNGHAKNVDDGWMTLLADKTFISLHFGVSREYEAKRAKTLFYLANLIWLGAESNRRHVDFQSTALPTELPSRHGADRVAPWGVHYAAM